MRAKSLMDWTGDPYAFALPPDRRRVKLTHWTAGNVFWADDAQGVSTRASSALAAKGWDAATLARESGLPLETVNTILSTGHGTFRDLEAVLDELGIRLVHIGEDVDA